MRELIFLDLELVLELHEASIVEHGGDRGVLDEGLLRSAVAMPETSFGGAYVHEGLPAMAAAYLFHLCKNHPFADGNKRTAAAAATAFLSLNLGEVPITDPEIANITLAVADGSLSKDELTAWFEHKLT